MNIHDDADDLKKKLNPLAYAVCVNQATEPPFSGVDLTQGKKGIFRCICCKAPLFHTMHKFDSNSGWPSFFQPHTEKALEYQQDYRLAQPRTEVKCANCKAHLGHVFPDGPLPTGMRFCINTVALAFDAE